MSSLATLIRRSFPLSVVALRFGAAYSALNVLAVPLHVAFDGLMYQNNARALFTSEFAFRYYWIREPIYPIFLKVTVLLGGGSDLVYTFTQAFLVGYLSYVLLSCTLEFVYDEFKIDPRIRKKLQSIAVILLAIALVANPQSMIWNSFVAKQTLITVFLLTFQVTIVKWFQQIRHHGHAPSPLIRVNWGASQLGPLLTASFLFGAIGSALSYTLGIVSALVFLVLFSAIASGSGDVRRSFSRKIQRQSYALNSPSIALGYFPRSRSNWLRVRRRAALFSSIFAACFSLSVSAYAGHSVSLWVWQEVKNSYSPESSYQAGIDPIEGSVLERWRTDPVHSISSSLFVFLNLSGIGPLRSGTDLHPYLGQELRPFAERSLGKGYECGSIVEYKGSWFEGRVDEDYVYWVNSTCKPQFLVGLLSMLLPISEPLHSGVIVFGAFCWLCSIFWRRSSLAVSCSVGFAFLLAYVVGQPLALDRYGLPLYFLFLPIVIAFSTLGLGRVLSVSRSK